MYEEYWQLSRKPFQNDLDTAFFYLSEKHEEALVRMLYAVSERKGLMCLVGEGGTGKSLMATIFSDELRRRGYKSSLATVLEDDPQLILRQWLQDLGLDATGKDHLANLNDLRDAASAAAADGRQLVLVADGAEQVQNARTLDFFRNLLDLGRGGDRLITLFLIGQDVLLGRVENNPGLGSCTDLTYIIKNLSHEETTNYIYHRMGLVGGNANVFDKAAFEAIYRATEGVPRLVNNLADMCLFTGAGKPAERISAEIVKEASTELLQTKGAV